MMLKFGKVVEIDETKVLARVEFEDQDGMISNWLFVPAKKSKDDKEYWMPDLDEHVACLADEKNEEGVIICAVYDKNNTPPISSKNKYHIKFKDDSYIEYDRENHKLTADIKGQAVIKTTEEAKIIAQKDVYVQSSTMINIIAPGLSAKIDDEEEFPDGITGEYRGKLHIIGQLDVTGPVNITGALTQAGAVDITGNIEHTGNQNTYGDIHATGDIIDTGGNTNHHTHV